jgi:hypothetical protein
MTDEYLYKIYQKARLDAIAETGVDMSITCSYTLDDLTNRILALD